MKSGKNPRESLEIVVTTEPPITRVMSSGVVYPVSVIAYTLPVADRAMDGGVVLKFTVGSFEYV
ncbi:hypothetical protein [Arthrobacter sp. FW306-06-A]|uniref:hypothetical protein n=1 Tax=Arthrobacter sp. FW306-06-A TaxID=2879621 RepID=UPI001F207341|nr:hypothetical protein [Arthrobacter sp. FW306-06-A]UKA69594.1 hypothetical protein LFT49_12505 [Arthrobacter sp. FW306-06-A]